MIARLAIVARETIYTPIASRHAIGSGETLKSDYRPGFLTTVLRRRLEGGGGAVDDLETVTEREPTDEELGIHKGLPVQAARMHFDQRTQQALRAVGLETEDLQAASEAIVEAVAEDAAALEDFFERHETVYSDMEMAHSSSAYPEHAVEYLDITTHADEMRGWLRFDTWGVYVEDGRILDSDDDYVELTLGPTINDRVRFAADRERLR